MTLSDTGATDVPTNTSSESEMISPEHLHRNLNMELVTRCRCHHHVTSVWPCAATWWWVGIRQFCYSAQSAHLLQVLCFILLFMTMQEGVEGIRGE